MTNDISCDGVSGRVVEQGHGMVARARGPVGPILKLRREKMVEHAVPGWKFPTASIRFVSSLAAETDLSTALPCGGYAPRQRRACRYSWHTQHRSSPGASLTGQHWLSSRKAKQKRKQKSICEPSWLFGRLAGISDAFLRGSTGKGGKDGKGMKKGGGLALDNHSHSHIFGALLQPRQARCHSFH